MLKEIILYGIAGISSLIVLGYSVHMFVGGLVSKQTENLLIILATFIGTAVIAYMIYDVVKRRKAMRWFDR